jgi:4-amino-4-deoxy-L-arabinose transferase-like glycosyltransferase
MRPVGHLSLALLGTGVACVVALHVIRPRVSPIERQLSEYALGPDGWLMDTAFATAAGGFTALAIFLAGSWGRPRLVPAALVVAAVALVLSAVYRLDANDETENAIHRWASGAAAAAVVVAAVGWSVADAGRRRPWRRGIDRPIALLALGLVMVSPALDDTFVAGIHQRLVWAALIAWSVVVAITELVGDHERRNAHRP